MLIVTKQFIGRGINGLTELTLETDEINEIQYETAYNKDTILEFHAKVISPSDSYFKEHPINKAKKFAIPARNISLICE